MDSVDNLRPASRRRARAACALVTALILSCPSPSSARAADVATPTPTRDGSHDFDWEIGTWTTNLRYLAEPLTGKKQWVELSGTSVVRGALGGRADRGGTARQGTAGKIEGVSLRLYNPKARQWTLNFANIRSGLLTAPVTGAFDGKGRGVFYGVDSANDSTVLVRFVISDVTANSARFEQAFSADGGATWETNWIAVDTRQ